MQKTAIPLAHDLNPQNYQIALDVARERFAANQPEKMAELSGCIYNHQCSYFTVCCLNHPFTITYPLGLVTYKDSDLQPPFALQLIMINYLARADGIPLAYNYIPYRHLEGGQTYYGAFVKTAIEPLSKVFGQQPELLQTAAQPFGGVPLTGISGNAVLIYLLPRVPLLFQIWAGDEEDGLPAQANILFDSTANHYLHTEDLGACDLVSRLIMAQVKNSSNR
ncbi:MAG TPA: DUF3786 domain-containing protein [Oscillospiraceae bacterium]|nr:DUF3786 domain-containing protein [Oscillospiraceae bacterium]